MNAQPLNEKRAGGAALTVEGLTRRFGPHTVLDNVSFTVASGQVVALIGPNGAGKSTLLRCVVGADRADGGQVRFGGRPIDESDPWVRAAVAAALDDVDFFPDLSVTEHLELLAFAHGAPVSGVGQVVSDLGLHAARDQLPPSLSAGQRKRLALASCFVRPRRLLVLDEPEQRLDAAGRSWLSRRLIEEKAAGMAVLIASHDAELVAAVADTRVELEA